MWSGCAGCLGDGGADGLFGAGGVADFVGDDFAGFVDDDEGGDGIDAELLAEGAELAVVEHGPGVAVFLHVLGGLFGGFVVVDSD